MVDDEEDEDDEELEDLEEPPQPATISAMTDAATATRESCLARRAAGLAVSAGPGAEAEDE